MTVTVFKTFAADEVLTASDLNASLTQIIDNQQSLGFPATASKDMDGQELILDADADTSITASTDDQIDFKALGKDQWIMLGTSGNEGNFQAIDTDTGTAAGPIWELYRNHGSGSTDNDVLGQLTFTGSDDAGNKETYATIEATILDASSGTEDGGLTFRTLQANTITDAFHIGLGLYYEGATDPGAGAIIATGYDVASGARGDLLIRDATNFDRIAVGTADQILISNGTDPAWAENPLPRGYLTGLTLSNDAGDTAFDINITAGTARNADDDGNLALTSEQTKQINASWATGNDAGGLASNLTLAEDTYHIFLILIGSTVEVGFDNSTVAANLISQHSATEYRRIGSIYTGSTPFNIVQFTHLDNEFLLKTPVVDINDVDPGTSAVTGTLASVPTDVQFQALASFSLRDDSFGAIISCLVTSLDQSDTAPSGTLNDLVIEGSTSDDITAIIFKSLRLSTAAAFRYRLSISNTDIDFRTVTHGWTDTRGRND